MHLKEKGENWKGEKFDLNYKAFSERYSSIQDDALLNIFSSQIKTINNEILLKNYKAEQRHCRELLSHSKNVFCNLQKRALGFRLKKSLFLNENAASKFKKMKTFYGHAQFTEYGTEHVLVSCLTYDKTGQFVFSGGDDQ